MLIYTLKDNNLTPTERMILGRLTILSVFGLVNIKYTPADAYDEFNLSKASFYNALNKLENLNFIVKEKECIKVDSLKIGLGSLNIRQKDNLLNELVQNLDNFEREFFLKFNYLTVCSLKNRLETCGYIYIYKYILDLDLLDLKKEKENIKEKERNLPVPVPAPAAKTNYPLSAKDCEQYFVAFAEKHAKDFPQLMSLNVQFEAEQFFNYWSIERNWIDNSRKKVKSVSGRVATWLQNWCSRNKSYKPNFKTNKNYSAIASEIFGAEEDVIEGEIVND